jgi:hypothetical protein
MSVNQANATYNASLKLTALRFLHTSMFSPTTQTWVKAINQNFFTQWPMFQAAKVRKFLRKSIPTAMGHLDQTCKNVRLTKTKRKTQCKDMEGIDNTNLHSEPTTKLFMASVVDIMEPTHKSYSNLTGNFPVYSQQGNLYVLVVYLYDTNAMLIEPMKNRSDAEQLRAYCTVLQQVSQNNMPNTIGWTMKHPQCSRTS